MWRAIDVAVSNNEGSDCPDEAGEGKEACLPLPIFFVVYGWGGLKALLPGVLRSESFPPSSAVGISRRVPIRSGDKWENRQLLCLVVSLLLKTLTDGL